MGQVLEIMTAAPTFAEATVGVDGPGDLEGFLGLESVAKFFAGGHGWQEGKNG
jgi:hypothetical protein